MAKIRKHSVRVRADKADKRFQYDIYYSSKVGGFYAKLPSDFDHILATYDHETLEKYSIRAIYIGRFNSRVDGYRLIADTEENLTRLVYNRIVDLLSKTLIERNVILIYLQTDENAYGSSQFNKDHMPVGGQLGLSYCVETKATANDTPKYFIVYKNGEATYKTEVSFYAKKITIIDDTPENRKGLERIYSLLKRLFDELKKYCESEESILELINNTKLLTFK